MSTSMMPDDRRSLTMRLTFIQYLVAAAFSVLAIAFWVFQVAQHEKFKEMAENNHLRKLPLPAPRGVLFDRHGKVLVDNQNTFNIALVREQTKDIDRTLNTLAAAIGVDATQLHEIVNRKRREPSYRPIVLVENASFPQVVAVRARQWELPGIFFQQVPTRKYPTSDMAAHLFGYVGEVTESQLKQEEFKGIESGAIVGHAGVEYAFNKYLMGADGDRLVVVNSLGREIREYAKEDPKQGRPIQLTIDADLQKAAEDGFRHFGEVQSGGAYNGSAVVLDPRSGEVLALVSLPAYDPNKFAVGIDSRSWSSLLSDPLKPLQNRTLQATYSPGSTFKLVVATAALEEGVANPNFSVYCGGGGVFYGRYFQCHLKGGHGTVDMRHAIEKSCNVYFYTLGNMLGVDKIHKWATLLGVGQKNGIDLPNEREGLVPSTEWKRRVKGEKWYAGETISVAIGQGQVNVTPLSLGVMMMTLANGGTRYTPHVLKAVDEGKGWVPVPAPPPQSRVKMKDSTISAVHDGLWLAVNGAGTAGRARIEGRDVSAKTGTAQVISLQGAKLARGKIDVRDHGWFVFFAPRDNPELAGVIFTEHSQHGYYGGPIAKHIIQTYYAKKEGKPLPVLTKPAAPGVLASVAPTTPARTGAAQQSPAQQQQQD